MSLYWIEGIEVRLAIVGRPRGNDWLDDDLKSLRRAGVDVLVSALTVSESKELGLAEEGAACRSCGIQFLSFPIEDCSVPASAGEFQKLIVFLSKLLASGKAVAVHCRAGIGRSSIITAGLLVANGVSLAAAFLAIESARGASVPDTAEQRRWMQKHLGKRE